MLADQPNPLLEKIIATYLDQLQAGEAPDREQLLDQHPEVTNDLESFFANHDRMELAGNDGAEEPTLPPGQALTEDVTLPPQEGPERHSTDAPGPVLGTTVR